MRGRFLVVARGNAMVSLRMVSGSPSMRPLTAVAALLAYGNPNIDLWRIGAEFVRPKWGIYRSLLSQKFLRDERVRFDQLCLAKGNNDCP